jgi:hypothetical protein
MGTLKGKSIKSSYQKLLQTNAEVSNTSLRGVQSGEGVDTALNLSTDRIEVLKLGVGTGGTQPDGLLHVMAVSAGNVTASSFANQLTLENSGDAGLSILSGDTSAGNIFFGDANDNDAGRISYDHANDDLKVFTAGSQNMKLDASGNLTISGSLAQSDDKFELKENFEKVPSLSDAAVTQDTSATTPVTLDAKYGIITMQAVDLAATDTVEFVFNNNHISTGSTIAVSTLHDTSGAIADNAMIWAITHDVADGSCKIRIGTNGTDVASQAFDISFIIDPYVTPNQNFVLSGVSGGGTQISSNLGRSNTFAGIKLLTGSTDNDRTTILPRSSGTELPATFQSSAWASVGFGSENKVEFSTALSTSVNVENAGIWAGLKLTDVGTYATDANQAYFVYGSDDTMGALTTNTNLHFVYSIAGTDYITDLGVTLAANTVYRLRILFDENRQISVFVNNTQYGLTSATTAGGVTQTATKAKSLAMTDDVDFIPVIGIQTFTALSKGIQCGYIKMSRDLYE